MKTLIETERLILREILETDEEAFFEMDSDPRVHTYLGNQPVKTIEEIRKAIQFIRQQYVDNGIGRWAAIEKESGNFIGWTGLKFVRETTNNRIDFYDVGYRLNPNYWNKGYATESAKAAIDYGFSKLDMNEIIGVAHVNNRASRNALEKCGLKFVEQFMWKDLTCDWLKLTREEWEKSK